MTAEVNQLITESRDERKREQRMNQPETQEPWLKSEHHHPPFRARTSPDLHCSSIRTYPCAHLIHIPTHTHVSRSHAPDKYRDSKVFDRRCAHSAHRPLTHSCHFQPRLSSIYSRRSLPDTAQFHPNAGVYLCVHLGHSIRLAFRYLFDLVYLWTCKQPTHVHTHMRVRGIW